MSAKTLVLKSPFGNTMLGVILIWILFLVSGELIARQGSFQSLFIAPGVGSTHGQFEKQLGRLRRIIREEGEIQCIFFGSSIVRVDFNPVHFYSAFKTKTGKPFSCFNFGVDGLTAAGAGVVAQVLVEKYDPQIIIYGTEPRDYSDPFDTWENITIIDSPWIQYQLGHPNILGWLFEHSFLLQYQEPLSKILHLKFYKDLSRYGDYTEAAKWGYLASTTEAIPVSIQPSKNDESKYVQAYFELLSDYYMFPENISGFEQFISQNKNGVDVLVIEMPVASRYLDFFTNGYKDYETYINTLSESLKFHSVPFLRTQSVLSIPIDGWWDYNHLNEDGARLFSEWLGGLVGEMYIENGSVPGP